MMPVAIRRHIDRKKARESFKQEALQSWQEYRETGRHLTFEEVEVWLNGWGTDNVRGVPLA